MTGKASDDDNIVAGWTSTTPNRSLFHQIRMMIPYICGGGESQASSSGTPLHVNELIEQVDRLVGLGEGGGLIEYIQKYGVEDGVLEFIESFLAYSPRPFDAAFEHLSDGSLELWAKMAGVVWCGVFVTSFRFTC